MKNKDLEKYSIALSVLTLQMKSLRNMAVRGPEEQAQICRAMRDIARAMVAQLANRLRLSKQTKKLAKTSATITTSTKAVSNGFKKRLMRKSVKKAAEDKRVG